MLHVGPRKPLDVNSCHKGYLPKARNTFRGAGLGRARGSRGWVIAVAGLYGRVVDAEHGYVDLLLLKRGCG